MRNDARPIAPPPRAVSDESLIAARTHPQGPLWGLFDAEARANANPNDPWIHHGSLEVSRSGEKQFEQAERYLSKDPEAMGVLYRLEHDTVPHTIRVRDDVCSDENGADISWNPHLATVDTSGNHISPALSLLHEEGHVLEPAARRVQLEDAPSAQFDDLEEQRNITGLEHRAAAILGEGQRTSHEGTNYWVSSVSSRQADPELNRRRALPNCDVDYIGGDEVMRPDQHAPKTKRERSR